MIYGYILIMVIMLPSGDIDSRAVDWFEDPYECVEMAQCINMKTIHHH